MCDYLQVRATIYRSAWINVETPKELFLIYDLSNTFHLRPQEKKISYHNVDNAWIHLFKIQAIKEAF